MKISSTHRVLVLLMLLLTAVFAMPAAAEPAAPEAIITFDGDFTLIQRDGPNCGYSGAPFTQGKLTFAVLSDQQSGRVDMNGSGQGARLRLRCEDWTFDLFWTVNYTIEAQGAVTIGGGNFSWPGQLKGVGSTEYLNCEIDGEPATCPFTPDADYEFPVLISGSLSCANGGKGDIIVQQIGLQTFGTFESQVQAPEGYSLAMLSGAAELNGLPLLHNCPVATKSGDKVTTNTQTKFRRICHDKISEEGYAFLFTLGDVSPTAAEFFVIMTDYQECDTFVVLDGKKALIADDPVLGFDVGLGTFSLNTPDESPEILIASPTAKTQVAGSSQVVSRVFQDGSAEFATLGSPITVVPENPSLPPVLLEYAQKVQVTADNVGPVIDLNLINMPFVNKSD